MRTIRKRTPPEPLVEWRQERVAARDGEAWPFTYDEMRRNPNVLRAVEEALIAEQGEICAYTGIRIRVLEGGSPGFHIEHLNPQTHCRRGEDTDYANLVACWPEPNSKVRADYGAGKKGNWPPPDQSRNFVSPLRTDCSERFAYSRTGRITAARNGDTAAITTIKKLGLNHKELAAKRREAIRGALMPQGRLLKLKEARRIQQAMERAEEDLNRGENVLLREFCFAIKPAIDREIRKLTAIHARRRE